jgi:hypothetical protein
MHPNVVVELEEEFRLRCLDSQMLTELSEEPVGGRVGPD